MNDDNRSCDCDDCRFVTQTPWYTWLMAYWLVTFARVMMKIADWLDPIERGALRSPDSEK